MSKDRSYKFTRQDLDQYAHIIDHVGDERTRMNMPKYNLVRYRQSLRALITIIEWELDRTKEVPSGRRQSRT